MELVRLFGKYALDVLEWVNGENAGFFTAMLAEMEAIIHEKADKRRRAAKN